LEIHFIITINISSHVVSHIVGTQVHGQVAMSAWSVAC